MKVRWEVALGMVFWSGVLFLVLSVVKFRERIINAIPRNLKYGAAAGIGVFIAFIGLQHAGLVEYHSETLVKLGSLAQKHTLVALFGVLATGVLLALRVKGAVLLGILATGLLAAATKLVTWRTGHELGLAETFLKLRPIEALSLSAIPPILTLLFFDMFDTVGTLLGVAEEAGLVDDEGRIPNAGRALASDAAGTVAGSLFGTSTVTSYIESAAGVAAGARTGLSSVVVAALFLLSLVALPFIGIFGQGVEIETVRLVGRPPGFYPHPVALYPITAPVLIVVGFLMAGALRKIGWEDVTEGLPAFLTVILMPLTFSISAGLAAGFVSYSFLKTVRGRAREVHWIVHVIAVCIVLGYAAIRIAALLTAPGA
jgi:AGZA family xanthine/uracil permease-like MFS transporter